LPPDAPNSISAGAPPQTPLGELTTLPKPPIAGFGAASRRGRGWIGKRRERGVEGEGGEVEGMDREGPQVTVQPGPLRSLLRH